MEKVYLVSSGHYSDYRVDAVFDSQEKAQAYIDSYGMYSEHNDVEEIDFNPISHVDYAKKGMYAFEVRINESLEVLNWRASKYIENKANKGLIEYPYKDMYCYVWARGWQHATKIASEKAREIKATVGWGRLIKE